MRFNIPGVSEAAYKMSERVPAFFPMDKKSPKSFGNNRYRGNPANIVIAKRI